MSCPLTPPIIQHNTSNALIKDVHIHHKKKKDVHNYKTMELIEHMAPVQTFKQIALLKWSIIWQLCTPSNNDRNQITSTLNPNPLLVNSSRLSSVRETPTHPPGNRSHIFKGIITYQQLPIRNRESKDSTHNPEKLDN